jgi:hypothetical protein
MTENDPTGSTPPEEESALSRQEEPDTSQPAEDPGFLTDGGVSSSNPVGPRLRSQGESVAASCCTEKEFSL